MEFVRSTKVLLVIALLVVFINDSSLGIENKFVRNDLGSIGSINDEHPFRMNKINLIFQKAKKILPEDDLPRLYSELVLQDRLEIEWKRQKAGGLDEDGEQEALVRRKFLNILNRYDLLDYYGNDAGKMENSVEKNKKSLFTEDMMKDKKLAKLWQKAQLSAFSEQELETLKVEFGHHMQKVAEYEQLKSEIDRIEAISENSIQRFKTDDDDERAKLKDKHSMLKKAYSDVKQSLEYLEQKSSEGTSSQDFFKDPRIAELWSLALKANLSGAELESFKEELGHFENKINKHEYFLKEAEMAKANVQIQGKHTDTPEIYHQLQQRVEDYASKIKKWYVELKRRVAKLPHREL